jgi:arsenate reductase
MAEGFLSSLDPELHVFSAGTNPASQVHPKAVAVMKEIGIDLSRANTKKIDPFLGESFNYVVTVCDDAKETCPVFSGKVQHRLHIGFDDPAEAAGTEEEILTVFRRVRDEIIAVFQQLYSERIKYGI